MIKRLNNLLLVCQQVKCVNKQLHSVDEAEWMYRVRMAVNCTEQNMVAILANTLSPVLTESKRRSNIQIILCTTRTIEPNEELCYWPSFELHMMLAIPFLTPANIINDKCYVCTRCGKCFQQPNPLKIHLRFACSTYSDLVAASSNQTILTASSHSGLYNDQPVSSTSTLLTTYSTNSKCHKRTTNTTTTNTNYLSKNNSQRNVSIDSTARKLHTCTFCGNYRQLNK